MTPDEITRLLSIDGTAWHVDATGTAARLSNLSRMSAQDVVSWLGEHFMGSAIGIIVTPRHFRTSNGVTFPVSVVEPQDPWGPPGTIQQ